jgi:23S rRNA (cytosine1962-C5)-methyltransferase
MVPDSGWIRPETLEAFCIAQTNAHRLYSSGPVWVERFGEDLLVSYQNEPSRDVLLAALPDWCAAQGLGWKRIFGKFIPRQNQERTAPVLLVGDAGAPMETVVEEGGMKFAMDFAAGYSAGLFIDQRANRSFLRRARAERVLNTFSYTCSFSVAAALGGGATTSVDLSKKSLDRGRENFALNGVDPGEGHRFYADDVLDLLPRFARKGETFDAIVLDPPTFSRGNKGRRFQVEHDFEQLLLAALEVATPQCRILLSTNCTRLTRRSLESIARHCLKLVRRPARFHSEQPLPDVPSESGAQTLWVI